MISNIPIVGKFIKAIKTKNAIQRGDNLYELEDWEVAKRGFLPAQEMATTLAILASLLTLLFSIGFMQIDIYDEFKKEYSNTAILLYDFLIPLMIYLSSLVGIKNLLNLEQRTEDNIQKAQRYFLYETYAKLFWWITFGNLSISVLWYLSSGSAQVSPWYDTIVSIPKPIYFTTFFISLIIGFIFIIKSIYFTYYKLPKSFLKNEFGNYQNKQLISYGINYFFKMFFVGILLTILINLSALGIAFLKTM